MWVKLRVYYALTLLQSVTEVRPYQTYQTSTLPDLTTRPSTVNDFEAHFGSDSWPGQHAVRLFDEVLVPVAAPNLLKDRETDWRTLPGISLSGPRDGWREWATAIGAAPPRTTSIRFDSFVNALHAATAGAGVLLASQALIQPQLESGQLILLPEKPLRMDKGYWLTWPEAQPFYSARETIVSLLTEKSSA